MMLKHFLSDVRNNGHFKNCLFNSYPIYGIIVVTPPIITSRKMTIPAAHVKAEKISSEFCFRYLLYSSIIIQSAYCQSVLSGV